MKKRKYQSPAVETTVTEVEAGFAISQKKPADWEDL